jgi:hypothetical protein
LKYSNATAQTPPAASTETPDIGREADKLGRRVVRIEVVMIAD